MFEGFWEYRDARFKEPGEKRNTWEFIKTPGPRAEAERVTEAERKWVDELSKSLFSEALIFRMCIGKPWGKRASSEDFSGKTLCSKTEKLNPQEWFESWSSRIPVGIKNYIAGRENSTTTIFKANDNWRVLYFHGVSSENMNAIDTRRCLAEYAYLLPAKGRAISMLTNKESAEALRVLPLAIMHSGMRGVKDEKEALYFDGSIVGGGGWRDPKKKKVFNSILIDIPGGIIKKIPDITEQFFSVKQMPSDELVRSISESSIAKNGSRRGGGVGSALKIELSGYWKCK